MKQGQHPQPLQTPLPTNKAFGQSSSAFYAPARQTRAAAPIVPAGSVTGRSLTIVIAIMCFLGCLMAGAVYIVNQSAAAWFDDIASEVTVQVKPIGATDMDKRVRQVSLYLSKHPGIKSVNPLSLERSAALLEPWLGRINVLSTLPVPRLIAVQVNRSSPPNISTLTQNLENSFNGVILDDHRHWQTQIRTVTRSLALGGITVLFLMGAATTAIIVSATRSALSSNREIVEVLHFVGATDTFIAREFEKHFLALGIRAGLIGALCAAVVFTIMPFIIQLVGGNAVTLAEIRRLLGSATLDFPGYLLLIAVVIVIAALCMLTSRYGVYRILNTQN
ncbi:MAG: ABC transporter permease [Pseudomonadota bacterium]